MLRFSRLQYLFPIGLFVALFLDGSLSQVFAGQLFKYPYSSVLHLTVLWIVFAVFLEDRSPLPLTLWTVFAGAIFDLYYTGIFGVYVVILPLIVYFNRAVKPWLDINFLTTLLMFIIDLTFAETMSYIWFSLAKVTDVAVSSFAVYTLGPTIAVNLALFVILYYPAQRLYLWAEKY